MIKKDVLLILLFDGRVTRFLGYFGKTRIVQFDDMLQFDIKGKIIAIGSLWTT